MKFQRDKYRCTEADLVGEFYHRARLAGLEVYLEVKLPSDAHRCGEMRADAVVVNGDEVVCCVEVKRDGKALPAMSRQSRAYAYLERDHRVPTIWINSVGGIDAVLVDIRSLMRTAA
jgi:hypothetical protein